MERWALLSAAALAREVVGGTTSVDIMGHEQDHRFAVEPGL